MRIERGQTSQYCEKATGLMSDK